MKIKKFFAIFLVIVVLFIDNKTVFGENNGEIISYSVSVFDDYTTLHTMKFKVYNNKVYANAIEISNLFGYNCRISVDNNSVIIAKGEDLFFSIFHSDSKNVDYMLGVHSLLKYTAPFESIIENEKTAWIPFEYFLLIADSNYIIIDNIIHIETPKITAVKILKQMTKDGFGEYCFDFFKELGYNESSFNIKSGASHLINYLNGILKFDPASWGLTITQFGNSNSYDKKYGDTLAKLFCTNHQGELREFIELEETIFDDTNELIKQMEIMDFEVGQWSRTCELMLDRMKGANPPTVTYNKLYQQLEKALSNQEKFSSFIEPIIGVKEKLPSSDNLNFISYGLKGYTYATEFDKQDEFSLNAFKRFIDKVTDDSYMSSATKKTMKNSVSKFEKNILEYTVSNIVSDNWLDVVVSETGLEEKLLGAQGVAIKFAWDLSSSFIPFLNKGLSDADNFELACYASLFQSDAWMIYDSERTAVLLGDFLNNQEIEESLYSTYTFLKSCLITREAGIASVSTIHAKFPEYIEPLKEKNRKIEDLMAKIKYIIASQDKRMYGFTQDIAKDYIDKYNDGLLLELLISKENYNLKFDKSDALNTYTWMIEPTYSYNDIQILKCIYEQPYGQASLAKITRSNLYANENKYEAVKELKGLYVVSNENGKKQLIDFNGKNVLNDYYDKIFVMEYYNIDTYENSYFIEVQKDGRSNWIDENYNLINIALQGLGGIFDDNCYYNIDDSSVWLESFMEYERANMSELSSISVPIESVKVVQGERKYDTEIHADLPGTGKFGLISYGNITVPMEYDGYYRLRNHFYYYDSKYGFSEDGRIVFYKDNKIYIFDENGKCYSEGKYDVVENANQEKYFYQGYLPVSLDGKWGYIDIYGNEVISCQFEDVTSVYDGKAWVKKGGKWGVIELTNGYIEETPSTKMPYEEVAEPVTTDKGVIAPHLEKAPSGFTPIYTADELSKIQTHSFAKYILMNDIDLSNWGNWIPIGTSDFTGFSGVFDGNGYNILNINVDISKNGENAYGGLFAKCWGGEIRNLGIVGGKISVKSYSYNMIAGGIAGYCKLDTKISNCFNTATIVATSLGNNWSSMNNYARIGGIIGDGDAIIENCFNTGNLTASDAYAISYVGGIAGTFSNSSMKNVYNTGNLESSAHYGSKYDNIGGLIGYEGNSNELINCYYLNTAANPIGYAFTKYLSETVKELTSSEIKLQSAFIGFDFDNIWAISEDVNNSYPYLKTVNFISIAPTENVSENTPTFTVEQIRNTIVGSWMGYPNFYTFSSDGTCTMFGDNQNKGTYRITDDKTLYISFPWMSESYEWNEDSLTDKKGWYMTEYMLIIKGQEIGRE